MVVLAAACGATGSPSARSSGPASGPSGAAASTASGAGPASDVAMTRLAAALHALAAGYDFDAVVRVGGAVATEARGRWIGGTSQFVLTSGGRSVTYRSVPPDAWVQQGDGSWIATQGAVPGGDPLAAFATPLTVAAASVPAASGAAGLALTVTYPANALGMAGSDPVVVAIRVGTDGSMVVTYASSTAAGAATSTTTITPATDRSPILAPGATPRPSG